jgi:anionic cell wall polymer biosynthesis LytR-Cps2A-Psr (LCP) family protein
MKKHIRQDTLKFVLIVAALILLQVVVVFVIEKRMTGAGAEVVDAAAEQTEKEPTLTLTLYDDTYISYHEFDTYLFIGTDDSGNEDPDDPADYYGSIADFINLLVIDHTDETYAILAINRDTMTYVPMMLEDGTVKQLALMQICTAHGYGGDLEKSAENTVNTVSSLLGELPIDGSFVFPVDAMPEVNSLVGGVTVTIEGDLTAMDPAFKDKATITLNDEQAEKFVRVRLGVGEGLNTERMGRQEQYIEGVKAKLGEKLSAEPALGVSIFDELKSYATTDINGKTVSRIANDLAGYTDLGTFGFEGELDLGQSLADGLDHYEFYLDSESQIRILTELFSLEEKD